MKSSNVNGVLLTRRIFEKHILEKETGDLSFLKGVAKSIQYEVVRILLTIFCEIQ